MNNPDLKIARKAKSLIQSALKEIVHLDEAKDVTVVQNELKRSLAAIKNVLSRLGDKKAYQ